MTGGIAVILGTVGRNFGAGMSGGIAYVLDEKDQFKQNCNSDDLNIDPIIFKDDIEQLRQLISNHVVATSSPLAKRILEDWENYLPKFKKVLPEEYRQALVRLKQEQLELA
jgi:glutamate synthase (NADPH/NADH) large chain